MNVTIIKHIGGYLVDVHDPSFYNQPAPPGYLSARIFTSLADALDYARTMLEDPKR